MERVEFKDHFKSGMEYYNYILNTEDPILVTFFRKLEIFLYYRTSYSRYTSCVSQRVLDIHLPKLYKSLIMMFDAEIDTCIDYIEDMIQLFEEEEKYEICYNLLEVKKNLDTISE